MNMDHQTTISIIIPCYNTPKEYIRRALNSASRQTFQSFEILVIDDGSDREHLDGLLELCGQAGNIRLIRVQHGGVSAARNAGVSEACGEYITFLDADDIISEDFLERAWAVQQKTSADLVIGGMCMVPDLTGFQFPLRNASPGYEEYSRDEAPQLRQRLIGPDNLIRFPGGYIGRGPVARLVKRTLAEDTPFDLDLETGEDIIWNMRLLKKCERICVVPEIWYCYWVNIDSVSHRYSPSFISRSAPHLKRLPELIDLSSRREYAAYLDRIHEELRNCWPGYLLEERIRNPAAYRAAIKQLYGERPWTEIQCRRGIATVGPQRKIVSLLYRFHLYFFVKALRERFTR